MAIKPNHFSCRRHFSPSSSRSSSPRSYWFLIVAKLPLSHVLLAPALGLVIRCRWKWDLQTCCEPLSPKPRRAAMRPYRWGKIFPHRTRMRLWCFHLSFNADLAFQPTISFVDSLITIKLNQSISIQIMFFKSTSSSISVNHSWNSPQFSLVQELFFPKIPTKRH
jgi:hypothetical protein